MNVFLGIDTSCYTTSLCLVDSSYHVAADERLILSVKKGSRGLSQSNMVYQHMRNLPVLFERLVPYLANARICAIGVTDKPRRREDSYMPAFLAGLGYGRSLAAVLHVIRKIICWRLCAIQAVCRNMIFMACICPAVRQICSRLCRMPKDWKLHA